jgi:hypothetical protein
MSNVQSSFEFTAPNLPSSRPQGISEIGEEQTRQSIEDKGLALAWLSGETNQLLDP